MENSDRLDLLFTVHLHHQLFIILTRRCQAVLSPHQVPLAQMDFGIDIRLRSQSLQLPAVHETVKNIQSARQKESCHQLAASHPIHLPKDVAHCSWPEE